LSIAASLLTSLTVVACDNESSSHDDSEQADTTGINSLASEEEPVEVEDVASEIFQDPDEALADDNARLALQAGLTLASVERSVAFQDNFERYQNDLIDRFPDRISATWVDPVPATSGHVRFVGEVPAAVREELDSTLLACGGDIVLEANGIFTMAQQRERAKLVALALQADGYTNFSTHAAIDSGKVLVHIRLSEETEEPKKEDVFNGMRSLSSISVNFAANKLSGRAEVLESDDVDLILSWGATPLMEQQHSRGGNWLGDDGFWECTSGWSVTGPNGDGIVTAGHCQGLNQFFQPGVAAYAIQWRREVYGLGGDVEYHTTVHKELPEFYANAIVRRDVTSTRSTGSMVGKSVCVYGRRSNRRECNHVVTTVGGTVLVPLPDGGTKLIGNLVQVAGGGTLMGDSGGGVVLEHSSVWCPFGEREWAFVFHSGCYYRS